MRTQVLLSWSGGKDSALTLQRLRSQADIEVAGLLTSITSDYDRVSVHGVRRSLLEMQAQQLALPVFEISLSASCTNDEYERSFLDTVGRVRSNLPDLSAIAFGDLFLEDVRAYRERLLTDSGIDPIFPIWGEDTAQLARRFVSDGFNARLVCVDTTQLDASFAGRVFDDELIRDLPPAVDPCGERGEFHTFVSGGPGFSAPVPYLVGEKVLRDNRFMYCDLISLGSEVSSARDNA